MSSGERRPGRTIQERRLLIFVFYQGPWDRAALWLYGIKGNTIVREVPDGSLRSRLAEWCDRRDTKWREKWARRWPDRKPHSWWEG